MKSILNQYNKHVKKSHDEFVKPTMKYADIIIPYGRENATAVEFVVENIKTKLKKMGIQPEERWPLSPGMPARKMEEYPYIVCADAKGKDIYEIANKLLSNSEPSLKYVWLEVLANKLFKSIIKSEKLLKCQFELVSTKQPVKPDSEVVILFQHAILTPETAKEINTTIKDVKKAEKKKKIIVAAIYSEPDIADMIEVDPDVVIYILLCNEQVSDLKDVILNDEELFKSPTKKEYYKAVEEVLSFLH